MEDYSTIAFVQAFTQFACKVFMLINEGSQLVKVYESMRLTFADIRKNYTKTQW